MTITAGNLNVIFQLKTAETIKGKIGKSEIVTDRNYQIDIGNVISNTSTHFHMSIIPITFMVYANTLNTWLMTRIDSHVYYGQETLFFVFLLCFLFCYVLSVDLWLHFSDIISFYFFFFTFNLLFTYHKYCSCYFS